MLWYGPPTILLLPASLVFFGKMVRNQEKTANSVANSSVLTSEQILPYQAGSCRAIFNQLIKKNN